MSDESLWAQTPAGRFRAAMGIRPETRLPTDDELRRAVEV